ncbi:MAG: hypothetical protein CMH64_01690 [Nanoarchaeota archaeon]|jgi:hypothetical protein|nr:hypothetical protein [Nanoarchaeota archaeon]|tara:strand:- start:825 stop:1127 length:303 start_codon:yes stop_codon:yes gene_type:complete
MKNPIKPQILKFVRYFYDSNLNYADQAIEKWFKAYIVLFVEIATNGLVFWLVLLSLTSIFNIDGINLGPGAWHLLNILQLGLILWFIEGLYKYGRGGYKK